MLLNNDSKSSDSKSKSTSADTALNNFFKNADGYPSYKIAKNALIDEGYSEADAIAALESANVDWDYNAKKQGEILLASNDGKYENYDDFIYGLYYECGFTLEQAQNAAKTLNVVKKEYELNSTGHYIWKNDSDGRRWDYFYDANNYFLYRQASFDNLDVYYDDEPETFHGKKNDFTTTPLKIRDRYLFTSMTIVTRYYDCDSSKNQYDFIVYCLEPDINTIYQNHGVITLTEGEPLTYSFTLDTPTWISAIACRPDTTDNINYSKELEIVGGTIASYSYEIT